MAKPTKIVVYFDDGTSYETSAQGVGSIFMNEGKARKCGHNPPYGPPPKKDTTTGTGDTGGEMALMDTGENCYVVNGVIICP